MNELMWVAMIYLANSYFPYIRKRNVHHALSNLPCSYHADRTSILKDLELLVLRPHGVVYVRWGEMHKTSLLLSYAELPTKYSPCNLRVMYVLPLPWFQSIMAISSGKPALAREKMKNLVEFS